MLRCWSSLLFLDVRAMVHRPRRNAIGGRGNFILKSVCTHIYIYVYIYTVFLDATDQPSSEATL